MSGGGVPARPDGPALSARGARIAAGVPGLLDGGFALYVADPFDRERNPEVRAAARGLRGNGALPVWFSVVSSRAS